MKQVGTLLAAALAASAVVAKSKDDDAHWRSPAPTAKYIKLLNKDTDKFVTSVASWASGIADEKLVVDSSFAVRTDGGDFTESCGDLSAHQGFSVLEAFLENPAHARSSLKEAEPLAWRPDEDCVAQRAFESLDGGSHAEFTVRCGKKKLAHAISGGSGFFAPRGRHGDKYVGGAKAAVTIGDDIEVAGELYVGKKVKGDLETNHLSWMICTTLSATALRRGTS
uniref:Secreted protein n=1 Tax=Achlya hypogyna TaxID=1202772 RepID=A0A0A7CPL9_ACHHY|nr:secreted protein [Achlya hypogyna]